MTKLCKDCKWCRPAEEYRAFFWLFLCIPVLGWLLLAFAGRFLRDARIRFSRCGAPQFSGDAELDLVTGEKEAESLSFCVPLQVAEIDVSPPRAVSVSPSSMVVLVEPEYAALKLSSSTLPVVTSLNVPLPVNVS